MMIMKTLGVRLIVLALVLNGLSVFCTTQGLLGGGLSLVTLSQFKTTIAPEVTLLKLNPESTRSYSSVFQTGISLILSSPTSEAPSHYSDLTLIPITCSYGLFSKAVYFKKVKPFVLFNGALTYSSAPFDVFSLGYGLETGIVVHLNARMNVQLSMSKLWINNTLADPFSIRFGFQKPILLEDGRLVNHAKLIKRWIRKRESNDGTKNNTSKHP